MAIPGKVFFLDVEPFDEERFRSTAPLGVQTKAERIAISNF
jgi:hypothetical protein